jgi:phage pi2 protein 07
MSGVQRIKVEYSELRNKRIFNWLRVKWSTANLEINELFIKVEYSEFRNQRIIDWTLYRLKFKCLILLNFAKDNKI